MKRENVVYSQLSEAIRLADNNIFDYRRISLILFDNIVENLLAFHVQNAVMHAWIMGELSKESYTKLLNSLKWFENVTKNSKEYNIIEERDVKMLDFCHKARNNVYHKFYEDERITDCCVFILSEFLYHNTTRLLDRNSYEVGTEYQKNRIKILNVSNLKSYDDLLIRLGDFCLKNAKPSELFSQIIMDYLNELIDFKEMIGEDWERFNSIIRRQLFWDIDYKNEKKKNLQLDIEIVVSQFKKKWKDLNQNSYNMYKSKAFELKTMPTSIAFEKFINLGDKILPYYSGMLLYCDDQEYKRNLLDDI